MASCRKSVYSVDLPLDIKDKKTVFEVTIDEEIYARLQKGSSISLSISLDTDMKDIALSMEQEEAKNKE